MCFYELFRDIKLVPQLGERLVENNSNQIVLQVEEQFEMVSNKVVMILWGYIKLRLVNR